MTFENNSWTVCQSLFCNRNRGGGNRLQTTTYCRLSNMSKYKSVIIRTVEGGFDGLIPHICIGTFRPLDKQDDRNKSIHTSKQELHILIIAY